MMYRHDAEALAARIEANDPGTRAEVARTNHTLLCDNVFSVLVYGLRFYPTLIKRPHEYDARYWEGR